MAQGNRTPDTRLDRNLPGSVDTRHTIRWWWWPLMGVVILVGVAAVIVDHSMGRGMDMLVDGVFCLDILAAVSMSAIDGMTDARERARGVRVMGTIGLLCMLAGIGLSLAPSGVSGWLAVIPFLVAAPCFIVAAVIAGTSIGKKE